MVTYLGAGVETGLTKVTPKNRQGTERSVGLQHLYGRGLALASGSGNVDWGARDQVQSNCDWEQHITFIYLAETIIQDNIFSGSSSPENF